MTGLRFTAPVLVLLVMVSAVLRCAGLATDFWLDEIWALDIARTVREPLQILTSIHFDTNHWLYTFYLYICGDCGWWPLYRIPALFAGIVTVPLLGLVAGGRGRLEAATALILAGFSYLLTVYSTEARGYSMMLMFAVMSYYLLGLYLEGGRRAHLIGFWFTSILGVLSHVTFIFVYAGFGAWTLYHMWHDDADAESWLVRLISVHVLPLAAYLWLYAVDIRLIIHGGADVEPLSGVLQQFAACTLGFPEFGLLPLSALACCLMIAAFEIAWMWFEKRAEAVFFAVVLSVGPALAAVQAMAGGFNYWVLRHFIVCLPFLLLLLVRFLARTYRSGRAGVIAYALLIGLYVLGNSIYLAGFFKDGRGHYLDAMRYIRSHTEGTVATVGSDHDFRNKMVFLFYKRLMPSDMTYSYCDSDQWPAGGPEWFLVHSTKKSAVTFRYYRAADGTEYELARRFDFSGLSGWHWFLYHRK